MYCSWKPNSKNFVCILFKLLNTKYCLAFFLFMNLDLNTTYLIPIKAHNDCGYCNYKRNSINIQSYMWSCAFMFKVIYIWLYCVIILFINILFQNYNFMFLDTYVYLFINKYLCCSLFKFDILSLFLSIFLFFQNALKITCKLVSSYDWFIVCSSL